MVIGTLSLSDPEDLAELFKVQVPPGVSGPCEVRHCKITEDGPWPRPGKRPRPGIYTELLRDGDVWMSDLPSETVYEQQPLLRALNRAPRNSPMVILGCGLGVVIRAALLLLHKGPIDVVEIDANVLALCQEHYEEQALFAGATVRFHLANAHDWPEATVGRWAIGWADIWRDLSEANLPQIEALQARYAPRCLWYGSWSEDEGRYLKGEREAGRVVPGIPVVQR